MKISRGLSFFFSFFFGHILKPLKIVWGVPKWKFLLWGDFLTSPTFDCTPGYTPATLGPWWGPGAEPLEAHRLWHL